jgi:hypothetical protein
VLTCIAIGCVMMVTTTVIHAGCMTAAIGLIRKTHADRWGSATAWTRLSVIAYLVLIMFVASLIEAALWAVTFLKTGAIAGVEPAFYFSMVTFTTLGYGDVVLEEQWRVLGSFEAANGIIMFGWTTALIVTAVHRVYLAAKPS